MILGYHLIWTAYGWWLPNDPRGSNSHEIRVERIAELGDIHYGRKLVQPSRAELRQFLEVAQEVLKHEPLEFTADDRKFVGTYLGEVIHERGWSCFACAVMPDHVHLLMRKHHDWAETMLEAFQKNSRDALIADKRRSVTHPVWGGKGWKVFVSTAEQLEVVVEYIRKNPIKIGLPEQEWEFVEPYCDR